MSAYSPQQKFERCLVETFYPEALNNPEEYAKKLKEILYEVDGDGVLIIGVKFPREALERARHFKPRKGDVLIATYPRSGTHWTNAIVLLVQNHHNLAEFSQPKVFKKHMFGIDFKVPDACGTYAVDEIEKWDGDRAFFTHFLPKHGFVDMMKRSPLKLIYVVRDLRDVLASMYHFMRNVLSRGCYDGTFEEVFEMFKQKKLIFGDWFDHVNQWWELGKQYEERFMFVKYEDIHADHAAFVRRVASFCDIKLDEETVRKIVELSKMKYLKDVVNEDPFRFMNAPEDEETKKADMAMRGIVGGWKSVFSETAHRYFEENCKDKEPFNILYGDG